MAVGKWALSRRRMLQCGAVSVMGALAASSIGAMPAWGVGEEDGTRTNPHFRLVVKDHQTGDVMLETTGPLKVMRGCVEQAAPSVCRVLEEAGEGDDILEADFAIPDPSTLGVPRAVKDETKEEEFGGIKARVSLAVNWGSDKSTIQIKSGTFSVTRMSPLVIFSNCFYGIMQKEHYLSDVFNGAATTISTGWPVQPFNTEADMWTCGGAVGGLLSSLTTGEQQDFTVEIYF